MFILQRIALLSVGKTADLTAVMGPHPTVAPTMLISGISSREYWSDLAILMLFHGLVGLHKILRYT